MNSIYDYTDYRSFLRDRFQELKKKNPSFSYRSFNRITGTKSSAFLKLVIDGKRNLADQGRQRIARGLKLNEQEKKHFEFLVKFNQATDHDEKDRYFRELSQSRKFVAAKPLMAAQYRLFSHWYYVAILELVRVASSTPKNLTWLHLHLKPSVGQRDIKKAVKELKELNLLTEDERHGLQRRESMLTTQEPARSLSVANFHLQMNQIASQALMQDEAQNREFSSLTVAISEQGFQRAKEEIQRFRKRLHSLIEQEDDGPKTLVGQIHLQLFRLSQ